MLGTFSMRVDRNQATRGTSGAASGDRIEGISTIRLMDAENSTCSQQSCRLWPKGIQH